MLALDDLDFRERIEEQVDGLIADKKLIAHNTGERMLIADPLLYKREMDLAKVFAGSLANSPEIASEDELTKILESEAGDLTFSQQQAVKVALTSRISVISGAAGSGKSHTIAAITRIGEKLGLDIALAAPTGKAARRLEELTGCEAKTIHRLLGYDGYGWKYKADNPLDYDVIILDELSMVDIHLAWRFFDAVDLSSAQIVLVGDCHQLPPIGPGNILRDLIDRKLLPTVILDQVVRQAGILKENSAAILAGKVNPTAPGTNGILRPWYVIDDLESDQQVVSTLLHIIEHKLTPLGVDPIRDIQVLTPIKKGPLGTFNLNIELQRLIQRLHFGVEVEPAATGKRPKFYQGDKLLQTRNDYRLGIMNGSIGFIRNIKEIEDEQGRPVEVMEIDFDGCIVDISVNSEEAKNLQLAYACTIHKTQGNEMPCAITIIHSLHYFMLHNCLLYTGVSRARKTSIILGDRKGIWAAATRQIVDKRKTFLSVI
ncbi:MAG: AAA family ATPase [Candidatus Schekmanbacteria bacterium]|nr:AAA family ATPase [Candidatus Schekmanbacteria bacterium]